MAALKCFEVFHKVTDDLLFKGTARECAEQFNVSVDAIRRAANYGSLIQCKYKVAESYESSDNDDGSCNELSRAAKKWDDFCEPIRKKYGIPVYKAKPGVR